MADSIREDNGVNAEDKGFISRVFGNYRKADAKMKNSAAAKLAGKVKLKGKKPLLAALDIYRPAAIRQLQVKIK